MKPKSNAAHLSAAERAAPPSPSLSIVERRDATGGEWADAYRQSLDATTTFFHGPEWAAVWADYTQGRFRPAPRAIRFTDGKLAVIGASIERRSTGLHRWHLSPQGTYGGWVSGDVLTAAHDLLLEQEILSRPSLVWRRPPAPPGSREATTLQGDTTYVIDLREGAERARARWKPQARRHVERARRAGALVRETVARSDWLAYAQVYRVTTTYWARPTSSYNARLFGLFHDLDSRDVRLWLTEIGGQVVAGTLVVTSRRRAVAWSTAMVRGVAPGLTNLLYWEVLEALAAEGFEEMDLNPSGGHEGVALFKAALGAAAVPAPLVVRRHWSDRVLSAGRGILLPRRNATPAG